MKVSLFSGLSVISVAAVVLACGDDHSHSHPHAKRSQSDAVQPTSWPSSPLVWGDINFIHTTDSHGWLLGHKKATYPEPNYSGDFGDFSSFVTHMKKEAERRKVDLLLVDSGDLHDGTGLSDGFPPGDVDGHESNKLIQQLPYDILSIGNHELYEYSVALDMYKNFAPYWNGSYLSSNVGIKVTGKNGKSAPVPIGARCRKFKTLRGRKVTAFGVLFNFTKNVADTIVQPVGDMVKETWFKLAIQEEPDFFLLVGHMPVSKDPPKSDLNSWPEVFKAIRSVHPYTPIFIFGGHTHIRDCVQLDTRSMSLESGRYMETVGWMSAKLDDKNSKEPLDITRRYLDANRNTYQYHTQFEDFDTKKGKEISQQLMALADKFNLNDVFGTAPQDYFLSRAPFASNNSLYSLLIDKLLPTVLAEVNPERAQAVPSIAIINFVSQRFDLYAGPFMRNDQFIVSPLNNKFLYFTVPYTVGSRVLKFLNTRKPRGKRSLSSTSAEHEYPEEYARGDVDATFNQWKRAQWEHAQQRRGDDDHKKEDKHGGDHEPTLGYVTQDSCPGFGDDTLHTPVPSYDDPPHYIASSLRPGVKNDEQIDVIFLEWFAPLIVSALNDLQSVQTYSVDGAKVYGDGTANTNTMYEIYAKAAWN
ncbi:hypothetical protein BS47DRAFT_1379355 [Hydnum rufescens UP504]|uniref:Putative 5'-nucleotidase C-terminal domain-containing protein n=1 Tax=Hydnum rufescens UP504 TaxID=1448309 RepID=A0A9P6E1Y9_9AGAM|nr:hypothetical protein BS47DRAFT_1379355 [Hydnum rufescens UP504]